MSKIYGFYHICTTIGWKIIVDDQIQKIINSGLYDDTTKIFVSIVGPEINKIVLPTKFEIIHFSNDTSCYEREILKYIHTFCNKSKDNVNLWYIHSKGISHIAKPTWKTVWDWKQFMEHFVIKQYKNCIEILKNNDTCGPNLHKEPKLHYSGNFWWANSNYVKSLELNIQQDYLGPEMWICSNNNAKHLCLFESGVNHYTTEFTKDKYNTSNNDINDIYDKLNKSGNIYITEAVYGYDKAMIDVMNRLGNCKSIADIMGINNLFMQFGDPFIGNSKTLSIIVNYESNPHKIVFYEFCSKFINYVIYSLREP